MPITEDERNLIGQLTGRLRAGKYERERMEAYAEGTARYTKLGLAIPEGLEDLTTIINAAKIVKESTEERIDIEGFRLPPETNADGTPKDIDPEAPDTDEEMWRWWQANDLDSESQLGHEDYITMGSFYTCVGTRADDPDTPRITVESPHNMTALYRPDNRTPRAVLRLYDSEPEVARGDRATLYVPGANVYLKRGKGTGGWVYDETDEHPGRDEFDIDECMATPFGNNAKLSDRSGVSELRDVVTLQDAAIRNLTNLQVGAETHALPLRGVAGAAASDFKDAATGEELTQWEAYFGAVWTIANPEARSFQFSASDLRNFHETTMHYMRLISMVYGLPPYYVGAGNDQGPGGDSIRASEARLIMRVRRKIRALSAGWERTMQLAHMMVNGGELDARYRSLEVLFRNPETPTMAQIIDGVVKLHADGLYSVRDALEDMPNVTATRRKRILLNLKAEKDEEAERSQKATQALADAMRTDGVEDEPQGGIPGFDPSSRTEDGGA